MDKSSPAHKENSSDIERPEVLGNPMKNGTFRSSDPSEMKDGLIPHVSIHPDGGNVMKCDGSGDLKDVGHIKVYGTKDCGDHVCVWLRIPLYVRDYLSSKYYGVPVRLPSLSRGEHLLYLAVDGTGLRLRKSLCYSHHVIRVHEAMLALGEQDTVNDLDVVSGISGSSGKHVSRSSCKNDWYIPPSDEIAQLTPFVLPEHVVRKGMSFDVNERYTLTKHVAQELRDIMCDEFWRDLTLYIDDCKIAFRSSPGYKFNLQSVIYDFVIGNSIDVRHVDTIERNWRRLRKKIMDDANNRIDGC